LSDYPSAAINIVVFVFCKTTEFY